MGKLPASHPLQQAYKTRQPELNAQELIAFFGCNQF